MLQLENRQTSAWNNYESYEQIMEFAEDYKEFLNTCKTERETVKELLQIAENNGFVDLNKKRRPLNAGDKIYVTRNHKTIALFVIGEKEIQHGMHLICSHADSPRLDLRANPLYEKDDMALMKTHYYGGIKKYQWVATALSMHGVVIKKGGERVEVSVGEQEDEPVFYISDLPKHLSANQLSITMETGITGEELNIISGSIPLKGKEKESIKRNILTLLNHKYHIRELDFVSAELEIVPAGKARDVGFDGSMIAAYGHDDRVCVYTALRAILEIEKPLYSIGFLCADKEEVGSVGNTGMNSDYLENIIAQFCSLQGKNDICSLRQALQNSKMISADVIVGMDVNHPECFETYNTAKLGLGPVLMKYGGRLGKNGCNDAHAEFMAYIRDIFDDNGVSWQTGEMGKIDLGGGGTLAPFAAKYGMEVLDCGVALLSMHAPYELASKVDVYEAYKAYKAFFATEKGLDAYM